MGLFICGVIFLFVIFLFYFLPDGSEEPKNNDEHNNFDEYNDDDVKQISETEEEKPLQYNELMVDEYRGKVYNLVKARIGQENCTFLHPHHDNSEFIDKLQNIQNQIPLNTSFLTEQEIEAKLKSLDFSDITKFIEAKKSGEKGKNYFLNEENQPCSTEEIAKEYYNSQGYIVVRAELDFWQMLFCLLFFEEIYCKHWDIISDIPYDYFNGCFYFMRADLINKKLEKIKNCDRLKYFIISQYNDFGKFPSRLLYPDGKTFGADILESDAITILFDYIPNNDIVKIFSRYVQYPSEYRSGMPDLIIFNENGYKLVEVKRLKEKIRYEQTEWISYMQENNIPTEILRVKGVEKCIKY